MTTYTDGIVVGYDGSGGSEQALRWAVQEAAARGTIVTALFRLSADPPAPLAEQAARRRAQELLARGLRPRGNGSAAIESSLLSREVSPRRCCATTAASPR